MIYSISFCQNFYDASRFLNLIFLQTVEVLSDVSAPDLALRLYLQCAQVYDRLVYPLSKPTIDIVHELKFSFIESSGSK